MVVVGVVVAGRRSTCTPLPWWTSQSTISSRSTPNRCRATAACLVLVGNTGQGKSRLLNTLLGVDAMLPTNGMRACTAAVIEIDWRGERPTAGVAQRVPPPAAQEDACVAAVRASAQPMSAEAQAAGSGASFRSDP